MTCVCFPVRLCPFNMNFAAVRPSHDCANGSHSMHKITAREACRPSLALLADGASTANGYIKLWARPAFAPRLLLSDWLLCVMHWTCHYVGCKSHDKSRLWTVRPVRDRKKRHTHMHIGREHWLSQFSTRIEVLKRYSALLYDYIQRSDTRNSVTRSFGTSRQSPMGSAIEREYQCVFGFETI